MAKKVYALPATGRVVKLVTLERQLTVRYCSIGDAAAIIAFIMKGRYRYGMRLLTDAETAAVRREEAELYIGGGI